MREETHYLKDDISWTGAIGLMQIMPATGKWIAQKMENPGYRESRLFNPRVNIKFGCWYIKFLFQDLGRDIFDVVAAYNGGQGSVKKWRKAYKGLKKIDFIEKIPFSQTRRYVKKVMKSYLMYRKIYSEKVVF
jgi:soluble lytic murein transglycosylase